MRGGELICVENVWFIKKKLVMGQSFLGVLRFNGGAWSNLVIHAVAGWYIGFH